MSITDELRDYIKQFLSQWGWDKHKLTEIADRIDAEHEEAIQQVLMGEGGVPATDENMAEHGWVRMPRDADGEYIHVGDVMEYPNGGREEVRFMTLNGAGWLVNEAGWLPVQLHHYHAPTVEDVLREFGDWYAHTKGGCDEDGIIAEYAAKLQLKEDA